MKNEYREAQKKLGCHGCKFAERKALRLGKACCTYPGRISVDSKGKCKNKPKAAKSTKRHL